MRASPPGKFGISPNPIGRVVDRQNFDVSSKSRRVSRVRLPARLTTADERAERGRNSRRPLSTASLSFRRKQNTNPVRVPEENKLIYVRKLLRAPSSTVPRTLLHGLGYFSENKFARSFLNNLTGTCTHAPAR